MSYTPTTWTTGDTITASALNKIENGIAGAGSALVCNSSYSSQADNYVLDKTVQDIYDALLAGTPVYIKYQYGAIDSSYIGTLYLAPVVKICNYDYTSVIRIMAIKPKLSNVGNIANLAVSGTLIYGATGLNQYPTYVNSTFVSPTYESTGTIE